MAVRERAGERTPAEAEAEVRFGRPRGILVLWLGILLAPLAVLFNLLTSYPLVAVACHGGSEWPVHLSHLGWAAVAALGGWLAWRELGRAGRAGRLDGGEPLGRGRFMGMMGVWGSAFFGLIVLAQWVAAVVLGPCMGT